MLTRVLKSKRHRAQAIGGPLRCEDSLGISRNVVDAVPLASDEQIPRGNEARGERFETCPIPSRSGWGFIVLNGHAAALARAGDPLTIMNFTKVDEQTTKRWKPKVAVLGNRNSIIRTRGT